MHSIRSIQRTIMITKGRVPWKKTRLAAYLPPLPISDLSDQLSVTTEQLKYLKDYATAKAVNRYTSSTIKVAMNNHNNISSNMDLDGITNHLKTQLEEKLSSTAEGVYA